MIRTYHPTIEYLYGHPSTEINKNENFMSVILKKNIKGKNINDVFEKIVDKQKIYKTSVGNSMCHNNSYEYLLLKDNTLEKYFANNIDNYTANALKKIIQLIKPILMPASKNKEIEEILDNIKKNNNVKI